MIKARPQGSIPKPDKEKFIALLDNVTRYHSAGRIKEESSMEGIAIENLFDFLDNHYQDYIRSLSSRLNDLRNQDKILAEVISLKQMVAEGLVEKEEKEEEKEEERDSGWTIRLDVFLPHWLILDKSTVLWTVKSEEGTRFWSKKDAEKVREYIIAKRFISLTANMEIVPYEGKE